MKPAHKISLGILLIILSPCIAIGATYLFDMSGGQAGRQFAIGVYGVVYSIGSLYTGVKLIIGK